MSYGKPCIRKTGILFSFPISKYEIFNLSVLEILNYFSFYNFQLILSIFLLSKKKFVFEKGCDPKNPLLAEYGDG